MGICQIIQNLGASYYVFCWKLLSYHYLFYLFNWILQLRFGCMSGNKNNFKLKQNQSRYHSKKRYFFIRSSHQRCHLKKICSEKFRKIRWKTPLPDSFFKKNRRRETCNFIKKETLVQMFSCEFCKIYKKTFLTEHVRTNASIFMS